MLGSEKPGMTCLEGKTREEVIADGGSVPFTLWVWVFADKQPGVGRKKMSQFLTTGGFEKRENPENVFTP